MVLPSLTSSVLHFFLFCVIFSAFWWLNIDTDDSRTCSCGQDCGEMKAVCIIHHEADDGCMYNIQYFLFKLPDGVKSGVLEGSSDWLAALSGGHQRTMVLQGEEGWGCNWDSALEKLCALQMRSGTQKSDHRWECQTSCVWLTVTLYCQKKSPEQKSSQENGRRRSWAN